jgi:hypothetical protein
VNSPARVDVSLARSLAGNVFGEEAGAVVYVDRTPREPGTVSIGADAVEIERPALVVFRDEAPGANWMHDCTYALVDLETGGVVMTKAADRPPQFGGLSDSWVVAADPEGRADLLPSRSQPLEEK